MSIRLKYGLGSAGKLIALSFLMLSATSHAATVTYNYDFTSAGTADPSMGNVLNFTNTNTGDGLQTVTVASWFENGAGFAAANGQQDTGAGIGVCNPDEGGACGSTWIDRSIDNTAGYDWVLLRFSEGVELNSFTITPDLDPSKLNKKQGVDVSIFAGWINNDTDANLAGKSYTDLTNPVVSGGLELGEFVFTTAKQKVPVDVSIAAVAGQPVWGNAILIGARRDQNNADRFTLTGMSTVVPLPPAAWLFMSALGILASRRKLS